MLFLCMGNDDTASRGCQRLRYPAVLSLRHGFGHRYRSAWRSLPGFFKRDRRCLFFCFSPHLFLRDRFSYRDEGTVILPVHHGQGFFDWYRQPGPFCTGRVIMSSLIVF